MKKILSFVCGCMIMFSCSNETDFIVDETKVLEMETLEVSNDVTLEDIQIYMEKSSPIASRNGGNAEIEVITYQNDTVMYLLKYSNGWEMMPGDKRFPLRVAYNDEGTLDYANMHDAQRAWFKSITEKISFMKQYGDTIQTAYTKVWNRLTSKIKQIKSDSRSGEGGWILHNTRVESNIPAYKNHLVTTLWHQNGAYKNFCPKKDSNPNKKKPAGCVAVAGAQVIYYLQKKWNYPSKTPSLELYNPVENNYTFSNWSFSDWNLIENNDTNAIARLIGNIGVLSNTEYHDYNSDANIIEDLPKAMNEYEIGYTARNIEWPCDIIIENLDDDLPVIGGLLYGNNISGGHALIIDGYRKVNTTYTDVYIYVNDLSSYPGDIYDHEDGGDPVPEEGPTQTTSYTITDYYYQFNWGGNLNDYDNTYYHSESTIPKIDEPSQIYQIKKQVMYNFYKK